MWAFPADVGMTPFSMDPGQAGAFFLASPATGMFLGATPSINFGDSTKFEFDLKPFWEIGLGMLVPGVLIALIGGRARNA